MAWTTPMTAVAGTGLTAAQWNASVRDNLLEVAPAKATGSAWPTHFTANGANAIAEREIRDETVTTQETTTSTSFTDLATTGPAVTLTTGDFALTFPASRAFNSASGVSYASVDITGATTSAATDGRGINKQGTDDIRAASVQLLATTPGSNVFTMKYRVSSGTGTFQSRRLCVMAF